MKNNKIKTYVIKRSVDQKMKLIKSGLYYKDVRTPGIAFLVSMLLVASIFFTIIFL